MSINSKFTKFKNDSNKTTHYKKRKTYSNLANVSEEKNTLPLLLQDNKTKKDTTNYAIKILENNNEQITISIIDNNNKQVTTMIDNNNKQQTTMIDYNKQQLTKIIDNNNKQLTTIIVNNFKITNEKYDKIIENLNEIKTNEETQFDLFATLCTNILIVLAFAVIIIVWNK